MKNELYGLEICKIWILDGNDSVTGNIILCTEKNAADRTAAAAEERMARALDGELTFSTRARDDDASTGLLSSFSVLFPRNYRSIVTTRRYLFLFVVSSRSSSPGFRATVITRASRAVYRLRGLAT